MTPVTGFQAKQRLWCLAEIPAWGVFVSFPMYCWVFLPFSVVVIDFSGPCLIRSRNSFSLRCLAEQVGAAVSQPPFILPNAATTILSLRPLSLAPGCSSPSSPVAELCSVCVWQGLLLTSAMPHASVPVLMWGKYNSLYNCSQRR